MRRIVYILLLVLLPCAMGQFFEPPPINPDPVSAVAEAAKAGKGDAARANNAVVPREQTRVAVLGYHNFSETKPVSEMLLRTSEFRAQMEQIRREGLRVISMKEFLDWRLGHLKLPARCVLITMDDGWRSVYTDAYPILKEFGYPFTLFLYTKYLTGRGDSMTPAMIREMQAHGATIGSHSTSHLYPKAWNEAEEEGREQVNELLDAEMGASLTRLSKLFGPINTYCYPGGFVTPAMLERISSYGYVAAFGIVPGKVSCNEDIWQIHRYMVFGTDETIFQYAIDFDNRYRPPAPRPDGKKRSPVPPFPVTPMPDAKVQADIPAITAQLSGVSGIDLSSVQMVVSGFGRVPAKVDASTTSVQWTPPFRIFLPKLTVRLTWKTYEGARGSATWFFYIDENITLQP